MANKILIVFLAFFVLGISISCASSNKKNEVQPVSSNPQFTDARVLLNAKILEIHSNYVLVEPIEGELALNSSHKITFATDHLDKIDVSIGDVVAIIYDGRIMEFYPARIIAVSWSILEKN
jgi:hypothetical protein